MDLQYADNDVLAPCDVFSELYDQLPAGKVLSIRGTVVRPQIAGLFRLPGSASVRLVLSTTEFAYVSQTKCTASLFGVAVETNFATGNYPQPFFRTNYQVCSTATAVASSMNVPRLRAYSCLYPVLSPRNR